MELVDRLVMVVILLMSLGVHECAHAWTALKFGDDTAQRMGRLTLNPIPHIDIYGLLPILFGVFIGWAKPVPVNPYKVRNPALGMPLIAAAGPVSNIIQMLAGCMIWFLAFQVFRMDPAGGGRIMYEIIRLYILINLVLALFNIFPIYPLDGGKVITLLMPDETAARYEEVMSRAGYFPLIGLILINISLNGAVFSFWFSMWAPLFNPVFRLFSVPIDLHTTF